MKKLYRKASTILIITYIIAMLCVIVLFRCVVYNVQVCSGSMEPTLLTGKYYIGNRLAYITREVKRGDIVSFWSDEYNVHLIKRVIGLPGETISFVGGYVYINGIKLDESNYLPPYPISFSEEVFIIPDDCYFMMGDSRMNSADSRFFENPFIHKKAIEARLMLDIKPFFILIFSIYLFMICGLFYFKRQIHKKYLSLYRHLK